MEIRVAWASKNSDDYFLINSQVSEETIASWAEHDDSNILFFIEVSTDI